MLKLQQVKLSSFVFGIMVKLLFLSQPKNIFVKTLHQILFHLKKRDDNLLTFLFLYKKPYQLMQKSSVLLEEQVYGTFYILNLILLYKTFLLFPRRQNKYHCKSIIKLFFSFLYSIILFSHYSVNHEEIFCDVIKVYDLVLGVFMMFD